MSATVQTRLTPGQRLARGLAYTVVGPVDVTRGVVGVGAHSARLGARQLRQRYRDGRLASELAGAQDTLAKELSAAHEVIASLPQALQEARRPKRRGRRRWVIGVAIVVTLAGGAAAFSIVRRSIERPGRREPSPRPPSVEVQPQP